MKFHKKFHLDIHSNILIGFIIWTVTRVMTSLLASNMNVRCKQREVIEFLDHEGFKQTEIVEKLQKVYKDKTLSQPTVCRWLNRFKSIVLDDDSDEEDVTTWIRHQPQ